MADVVLLEVADAVAVVTINRPEARNALSREVRRSLIAAMREAEGRDDVAAVVLTGADPAFCAGLDLKELGAGTDSLAGAGASGGGGGSSVTGPLPNMSKPVIGAVNGVAITGGLELALACDFLIASDRARFADTHARVGIQPAWGLTVLLPQAIGLRRAREMSATGNFVDASTALAWGLVNHVVEHEELMPFARHLAMDIASNDARAVRTIYATYDQGSLVAAGEALEIELRVAAEWQGSGLDPAAIEERRRSVVDRGRSQVQEA